MYYNYADMFKNLWSKEDLDKTSTTDILLGESSYGETGLLYEVREVVRAYLDSMDEETLIRMGDEIEEDVNDVIAIDLCLEIEHVLDNK